MWGRLKVHPVVPEEGIPAPASQALGILRGRLEDRWEEPWNHPAGPWEGTGLSENCQGYLGHEASERLFTRRRT